MSTMGRSDKTGAFERPENEEQLEEILKEAYSYAVNRNYEKAIGLCDQLIHEPATAIAGYRQRAAVLSHMADIDRAIIDLKVVLEADPQEPADLHALGMLLLQNGSTIEAIIRFGEAVKVGDTANNHYYKNSSLLFGAESKLKVCDFEGAMADVAGLPDGYKAYFSGLGMRSKEDIAGEARAAIARKAQSKFQFKK